MALANDNAIDEILLRGATGACYFLEIESIVRAHAHDMARVEARPLVKETIRRLLSEGLMVVGRFRSTERDGRPFSELVLWPGDVETHLERIEREAIRLGDDLNIGDVAWFEITANGLARARAVLLKQER